MTDKSTPIVTDFETALNLSINKWRELKNDLNNVFVKWDNFCGFCHYALYLRDKAGQVGDHDKCTYCDKRIRKVCDELTIFEGKDELNEKIKETLEFLDELKTELKTDA